MKSSISDLQESGIPVRSPYNQDCRIFAYANRTTTLGPSGKSGYMGMFENQGPLGVGAAVCPHSSFWLRISELA